MPPAPPRASRRSLLRAGVVVALSLAFGAAVNFGVMWWCVRGFERGKGMMGGRPVAPQGLVPGGMKPMNVAWPPSKWTADVPSGWSKPNWVMSEDFGWLSMTTESVLWGDHQRFASGRVHHTEVGWPMRCWWCAQGRVQGPGRQLWARDFSLRCADIPARLRESLGVSQLPIGIHPLPFIANTLLYAAIPLGLWLGIGPLRRRRRRRAGRCPRCGYDRAGLAAGAVCPECGHATPPSV